MPELKITRRHLPHWQLGGSIYFVTFRTKRIFLKEAERARILGHICEGDGKFYDLFAAVIMPDHVHVLLRPREGYDLSRVMKGIKGVSARVINRERCMRGTVWRDESYDRIVRDGREFDQKLIYMYENPIKKGLAPDPSLYCGWFVDVKKCGFDVPDFDDLLNREDGSCAD